MKNRYIASFEAAQIASKEVPAFRAGDTLRLGVEIKEGEKKRVQTFEGRRNFFTASRKRVKCRRSGNGVI